jgi:hypothetical protein
VNYINSKNNCTKLSQNPTKEQALKHAN